ncbi:MAG TPA: hypothetical protein DCS08_03550 [Candidatus Moranbacteria bacterium]|nr:MAG: hypothetical protein US27_C0022G0004 [Candidatus Moranbacteria bacterium GW2011_GWF1_36_78]HAT74055.1 hypothetical protein [Candidatus Moranbacteria bacterium]HBY11307.1 hypothetical protein [Candidatus Moranbacteria bacterium]
MKQSWNDYETAAENGPMAIMFKVFFAVLAFLLVVSAVGYFLSWFGEAAKVAQEEFGAKAALTKYEWFIDQANAIEKMDKDVGLFETRIKSVDDQYKGYGEDMAKWPPHIQMQYNGERQQARDDLIAVASQRNNLVKEYNSSSEKFNWKPFQTRPDKPKERFHEYVTP